MKKIIKAANNQCHARRQRPLERRLFAYALGSSAAVLSATPADAGIISSGIQNATVTSAGSPNVPSTSVILSVDAGDATNTAFAFGWYSPSIDVGLPGGSLVGLDLTLAGSTMQFFKSAQVFSSANKKSYRNYALGEIVGNDGFTWASSGGGAGFSFYNPDNSYHSDSSLESNWAAGGSGFAGFRFTSGGFYHYGWMEVTVPTTSAAGQNATIVQWAYESTPDTLIPAGAGAVSSVPEIDPSGVPAALATLVGGLALLEQMGFTSGAAGLRAWRKRRRQTA